MFGYCPCKEDAASILSFDPVSSSPVIDVLLRWVFQKGRQSGSASEGNHFDSFIC